MLKANDYLMVHFIEPQPIGLQFERSRNAYPLHLTLAPWFSVHDIERLRLGLDDVAANHKSFNLEVGDDVLFGPDEDIPVSLIDSSLDEQQLHWALVSAVNDAKGSFVSDRWIGDNHRAHITHHQDNRLYKGDVVSVDDFYLVQLQSANTCEVAARFLLASDG